MNGMKMLTKNVERMIRKQEVRRCISYSYKLEHRCWWPTNSRITRTLIIKCHVPNSDWSQYDSKIYNVHDSYAKALEHEKKLAASSES
ncbi:hypothetical protein JTB14_014945 [Gonioctena quinquepunctata]|nr:hypothetical protein JTB14_014945 [Gonioctena quinquepunctata]